MRQCTTCGTSGLFLRLDENGNCNKCQEALADQVKRERQRVLEEKQEAAKVYHDRLVCIYSRLPADFKYSIPCDTSDIRSIILVFDELLETLKEHTQYERFKDVFITFVGTPDQYGFAEHTVFKCQSFYTKRENPVSVFMEDLIRLINTLRDDYQTVALKTDRFYSLVSSVEYVSIIADYEAKKIRKPLSDFPDVSITNMTKRTTESTVSDFIVIDLETTGLKPSINEIVQLCAVRFEGGAPVECFLSFVKPTKGIIKEAQQVNGITEDMIKEAPLIEQIMDSFDSFIKGGLPLIGHNIHFDLKFLNTHGSRTPTQKRKFYDTCSLAKKAYPDAEYSLDYLCDSKLRIARYDNHSALSDCIATGLLFIEIKGEIDKV